MGSYSARIRRVRVATLLLLVLALSPPTVRAAESGTEERPRRATDTTYESPILSLLLLPVTVLVKMASVFATDGSKAPAQPASRGAATPSGNLLAPDGRSIGRRRSSGAIELDGEGEQPVLECQVALDLAAVQEERRRRANLQPPAG